MKAIIDPTKCIHCQPRCHVSKECPIKAVFRISDEESAVVDMGLCHGCGVCTKACPAQAVIMRES